MFLWIQRERRLVISARRRVPKRANEGGKCARIRRRPLPRDVHYSSLTIARESSLCVPPRLISVFSVQSFKQSVLFVIVEIGKKNTVLYIKYLKRLREREFNDTMKSRLFEDRKDICKKYKRTFHINKKRRSSLYPPKIKCCLLLEV